MAFSDEINKCIESTTNNINDVICTFSLANGITIEGYKKILELSDTKIILLCQNAARLQILGTNFCIEEIAFGEICISGKVDSIIKI